MSARGVERPYLNDSLRHRENQRLVRFDLNLYGDESLDPAAFAAAFNQNF